MEEGELIIQSVIPKSLFKRTERIPPEWFWKDHRIPMQLRNIEEGYVALDYYIMAWLIYVIPNFWDVVRYYGR
jgi:hypothetical protein